MIKNIKMTKIYTITSSHPWFENVSLILHIDNNIINKKEWVVNGHSYQINNNNINSIIYDIKMTFKLTGLGYNHQNIHTIYIDDELFNDIDVIKLLYSHRIHGRVSLIRKENSNVKLFSNPYYAELFNIFGDLLDSNSKSHNYEDHLCYLPHEEKWNNIIGHMLHNKLYFNHPDSACISLIQCKQNIIYEDEHNIHYKTILNDQEINILWDYY